MFLLSTVRKKMILHKETCIMDNLDMAPKAKVVWQWFFTLITFYTEHFMINNIQQKFFKKKEVHGDSVKWLGKIENVKYD